MPPITPASYTAITMKEPAEVDKRMQNRKAPGFDGLPVAGL